MQEDVVRDGRRVKVVRVEDGCLVEREQTYRTPEAADKVYTLLMFDKEARAAFLRNRRARRTQT